MEIYILQIYELINIVQILKHGINFLLGDIPNRQSLKVYLTFLLTGVKNINFNLKKIYYCGFTTDYKIYPYNSIAQTESGYENVLSVLQKLIKKFPITQ